MMSSLNLVLYNYLIEPKLWCLNCQDPAAVYQTFTYVYTSPVKVVKWFSKVSLTWKSVKWYSGRKKNQTVCMHWPHILLNTWQVIRKLFLVWSGNSTCLSDWWLEVTSLFMSIPRCCLIFFSLLYKHQKGWIPEWVVWCPYNATKISMCIQVWYV